MACVCRAMVHMKSVNLAIGQNGFKLLLSILLCRGTTSRSRKHQKNEKTNFVPHLPESASQVQQAEAEVQGVRQAEEEVRISVRGVRREG